LLLSGRDRLSTILTRSEDLQVEVVGNTRRESTTENPADKWQGAAPRSLSDSRERLVEHSTICGMTDDDVDRAEPLSAKAVTALLREARSLSRRADKLGGAAAAMDDPTTQQLAAEACTSVEQLVHHLMLLERQLQRGEKSAGRRR
jgi:hypothetical protein